MSEDTSGFYRLDPEAGLLHGPNFVMAPTFTLRRETHEQETYPVGGWYWFESDAEARTFFGLPPSPVTGLDN